MTGKDFGIKSIENLQTLANIVDTGKKTIAHIRTYGPNNSDMDKHMDQSTISILNKHRSTVWSSYFWTAVDMYDWSIAMCYDILSDIKKYA